MYREPEGDVLPITALLAFYLRVFFSQLLVGPHPRSPAQRRSYVAGFADFLL